MWIISKTGFVSLVEHNTDNTKLRARARRCEHLADTFPGCVIEDLGIDAPDYRWHTDVARQDAIDCLSASVEGIDYQSHVKEHVAGDDDVFYNALMGCWTALHRLQPGHPGGWGEPPERVSSDIASLSDEIADRMTAAAGYAPSDVLDVDTALDIAESYTTEDDDDDEVLAAMLVLADEVRRYREIAK